MGKTKTPKPAAPAKTQVLSRRRLLMAAAPLAAVGAGALFLGWPAGSASAGTISVVKSPYCGCCGKWVVYLERAGWTAEVENVEDVAPYKRGMGVPDQLSGCHTASVDGYVIEGHVPLPAIEKLLAERPDLTGIAVPGMPADAPGMRGGGLIDVVGFRDGKPAGLFMRTRG